MLGCKTVSEHYLPISSQRRDKSACCVLSLSCLVAAVTEDLQDQEGLGQEGQAEQTYSTVDQIQNRQQDQVALPVRSC